MKSYYYAGGQRVTIRQGANTLYFLLTDHLGSTAITTTSTGGFYSELRYMPWGGTRYTSATTPTTYRYTGQREAEIGLYDYGARFYDPFVGRFISPDTIIPYPNDPVSYDRYSYTMNNPMLYVDPSGHRTCTPEDAASGDETCDQNIVDEGDSSFRVVLFAVGWNVRIGNIYEPDDDERYGRGMELLNVVLSTAREYYDMATDEVVYPDFFIWLIIEDHADGGSSFIGFNINNYSTNLRVTINSVTFGTPDNIIPTMYNNQITLTNQEGPLLTSEPGTSTFLNFAAYPQGNSMCQFPTFSNTLVSLSVNVTSEIIYRESVDRFTYNWSSVYRAW